MLQRKTIESKCSRFDFPGINKQFVFLYQSDLIDFESSATKNNSDPVVRDMTSAERIIINCGSRNYGYSQNGMCVCCVSLLRPWPLAQPEFANILQNYFVRACEKIFGHCHRRSLVLCVVI